MSKEHRPLILHCLPQVLRYLPMESLKLLKELGPSFKPHIFLPALVELEMSLPANSPIIEEIIKYLRHLIERAGYGFFSSSMIVLFNCFYCWNIVCEMKQLTITIYFYCQSTNRMKWYNILKSTLGNKNCPLT